MERKALIVDDNLEQLWSCAGVLKERGFSVTACSRPEEVVGEFKKDRPDLVLLDIKMPKVSGFDLLREIRELDSQVCIIMLSAYGDSETVVQALKSGADNFAEKPLDPEKLMLLVDKELTNRELEREVRTLRGMQDEGPATVKDIIGKSEAIEKIRKEIRMYADTANVVLITGRPGVGKNLVARALHGESSRRSNAFVHRHCGTFAPAIFESAVFGHLKGAFTDARYDKKGAIEAAENGTLFLDEIGTLTTETQAKLLLVIEGGFYSKVGDEGNVERTNAKFIAATNDDIEQAVMEHKFREDLFHRLKDAWIEVPPLIERREDILPLVDYFMEVEARKNHVPPVELSTETRELLYNHKWPDNVRGIRHTVKNVVRLGDESAVKARLSRRQPVVKTHGVSTEDCSDLRAKVRAAVEDVEKNTIRSCLIKHGGNRRKVAKQLRISYRSLLYKMKQYGLRESVYTRSEDAQ